MAQRVTDVQLRAWVHHGGPLSAKALGDGLYFRTHKSGAVQHAGPVLRAIVDRRCAISSVPSSMRVNVVLSRSTRPLASTCWMQAARRGVSHAI